MKKIYTLYLAIASLLITAGANAQSFSWSNYSTGANSYNASNLGVTMSVNGNGSGFVSGFPNYGATSGGYLNLGADWSNRTSNMKYTITFSKPLVGVLFLLYDVDQGGTWDDKITIAGVNADNVAVNPIITPSTYNTVSGNVIEGNADNASYLNNPAIVSFGSAAVKSFTITYAAGANSPSNPAAQYIGIGTITYGTVLPVELKSFNAEKRSSQVLLKWEVENMINFSHFEVERSSTGVGGFETVGTVPAGGADRGNFNYTDLQAQSRMIRAFYRLKMVDVDGKFKYSQVVMVSFGAAPADVRPTVLSAGEPVRVSPGGNATSAYDIRVFDAGGRMVQQKTGVTGAVQLETTMLKKGIYFITVADGAQQNTFRIAVQ